MKRLIFLLLAILAIPQGSTAGEEIKHGAIGPPPGTSGEWLTGSIDFGYRWMNGVRGNLDAYRSVVNIGAGPRLFGLDWTLRDPSRWLFDRVEFRAYSWGGDPYNTTQVDARRDGIYRFTFDYRNIAYFNSLPSFANPGRDQSLLINERSFNTFRRTSDVRLTLFPNRRIVPYLAYTLSSGRGTGTTVFFSGANDFPVSNRLRDHSDNYRGGLQIQLNPFHVTLEQGWSTFKDDQQVSNSQPNPGNVITPFQLFLAELQQAYGVRGNSTYSKVLITGSPVRWASIYGQFLYSRARTKVDYLQNDRTFFLFNGAQFSSAEQALIHSDARLPHSAASFAVELRPSGRVRLVESWLTDRLSDASGAVLAEQFLLPVPLTDLPKVRFSDRVEWNYSQQETSLFFDVNRNLTLRGGYRYVWGGAEVRAARARPGGEIEPGKLRSHVLLTGLNWYGAHGINGTVDLEAARGDRTFFRTSLKDYQKASARVRYQMLPSLVLSANVLVLHNTNPEPTINYALLSRQNTLSATWTPNKGKGLSVLAEYSRYTLRSTLNFLVPNTLERVGSFYRDNGHMGTSLVSLTLPKAGHRSIYRIAFGGSFAVSSGSRPTRYYQPMMRFSVPLGKHVEWNSEWRWFGLSESLFPFEAFRRHELVTGLRLMM